MAFLWGERRAGRYRMACSAKIIKLQNAAKTGFLENHIGGFPPVFLI
jgi:hypothetical protein